MKKQLTLAGILIGCHLSLLCGAKGPSTATPQAPAPFLLMENKGQITDAQHQVRNDIGFTLKDKRATIFIGSGHVHYQWTKQRAGADPVVYRMDVSLLGANPRAKGEGIEQQPYYENFLLAARENNMITAHAYKKIIYKNVYPHIDWVLYVKEDKLEYDFVVHPGARVSDIRIQYRGADKMKLEQDGSLSVTTVAGSVTEQKPVAYTMTASGKRSVPSAFTLKNGVLGFTTAAYSGTLVIDPVLSWSTYYGSTGTERGSSVATDQLGNVYMAGVTTSDANIATTGSYQNVMSGSNQNNAFLVKFNSAGQRLWATYYGGDVWEYGNSVACDADGNIILSGMTVSETGVATPGAQQATAAGSGDLFVAKFNSAGQRLWATYFGGSESETNGNYDFRNTLTCDANGNIYLCGASNSDTGIATAGAHQVTRGGGSTASSNIDAFLVKYNAMGVRQWSTYYGGSAVDIGYGVSCDAAGNVYLTGETKSTTGIATPGSYQDTLNGTRNGFLVKFNPAGQRQWASYYGTQNYYNTAAIATFTYARSVTCDAWDNVYIAGNTQSLQGIATAGVHQDTCACKVEEGNVAGYYFNHGFDAFVAKFNTSGTRIWGTYYGGTSPSGNLGTESSKVMINASGDVYLAGTTYIDNGIASPGAYEEQFNAGNGGTWNDAYLVKFDSAGSRQWGTYFGGAAGEEGLGAALLGSAHVYICGATYNSLTGIASPNAFQTSSGGEYDAFLAQFNDCDLPAANIAETGGTITETPDYTLITFCEGDSTRLAANPGAGLQYQWFRNSIALTGATDSIYHATTAGNYTVVISRDACSDTARVDSVVVYPKPVPVVTFNGTDLTTGSYAAYQWYLNNNPIAGATAATYHPLQNGDYSVEVTNDKGCKGRSALFTFNGTGVTSIGKDWESLQLYPNPNNGHFTISGKLRSRKGGTLHFRVFDINGKVCYTYEFEQQGTDEVKLPVQVSFSPGVYLLKVTTGETSSNLPFVIR